MGVSVLYRAIPPTSTLYEGLQQEKAFNTLMVSLFPYGCGIYRFFEIEGDEVEEILEWVIESNQDTFGSESEVRSWINEFQSELERTRNLYPGIENRTASMEKSSYEIEKRLVQELTRRQGEDATDIVSRLMFGDQTLASHLVPPEGDVLGLISLPLVQEGARILQEVEPEMLFTEDEDWQKWYMEHFQKWRELYFLAAENQEEILVGFA